MKHFATKYKKLTFASNIYGMEIAFVYVNFNVFVL